MEELKRVLEKTVSHLQADQTEAINFIQDSILRDFDNFLKSLSDIVYDQQNQPVVRAAAGLQLKNQLTARDEVLRLRQQERWRNLPNATRQYIKDRIFTTLGTEVFRPFSAPQCLAYIALAELSEKQWPNFINLLVENIKSNQNLAITDKLKLATLEALGYVCQEITSNEHQSHSKRRELTAGLNSSMTAIYSFIGDCISSRNYDLMTTSLQCLAGLLTWAEFNKDLITFLCQLLKSYDLQPGQVSHELSERKIAIMNHICECLNVCLERKHTKTDSMEVRTSFYEDENNLRLIISTLDELNRSTMQNDLHSISEVEKKLCQVLTNIMRYVYIFPSEKPQNLQDMYSIMKMIIAHPLITVSFGAVKFWNKVFAVSPKRPNAAMSDDLTVSLLITCANKLIKANYDIQLYGYEFDCQQDFDSFQSKFRGELCELCRNLTLQNERICFELVCNYIAKSIQQRSTNVNEWDALSFLTAAVCTKLKDPTLYLINGVELIKALMLSMDSAFEQAASIPPNSSGSDASLIPDLISSQLSCVSAFNVFLPYWHRNDKELTKQLLNKIILYALHRPDKFISSSRQIVGNNTNLLNNEAFLRGFRSLSRHASASFVRICLNHSKHLIDIFDHLRTSVDCLLLKVVDNPFSSEKCQLYEGLTLICNEEPDEMVRKKFALDLFESINWFKDYELNCDQFIQFVGLDQLEVDHDDVSSQMNAPYISAPHLHKIKLNYVVNLIGSITKRMNSRVTLLPEILAFARPILNIIFTMHALWLPEMKAKCVKEYEAFLFAPFNNSYKQQILDTILVNQRSTSVNDGYAISNLSDTNTVGCVTFGDVNSRPSRGVGQYIEIFSWNFYESLLVTMGAIINKTSPEIFGCINTVHLQTALTGAEYLPPLKMHKLIKHLIMPLVNTCSKDQHLIETQLLPLLSKLLPFLFEMLDGQWKKSTKQEETTLNGACDSKTDQSQILADEMVQDQLLRNLSRDFVDLMNLILVEAIQPSANENMNNHSSSITPVHVGNLSSSHSQTAGNRPNNQDLHKIGTLGLNLLATGSNFVLKVMASTLTWSDSMLNAKAISINQQLIKHILASSSITSIDQASMWLGCMFGSVITSLRMFGEHEQNCSGLLTLFLCLYDSLNKTIPNFHDQLERMTGIPKTAFQRYDQENFKSNEKNKRVGLRKVLDSLVGNKVTLIMK